MDRVTLRHASAVAGVVVAVAGIGVALRSSAHGQDGVPLQPITHYTNVTAAGEGLSTLGPDPLAPINSLGFMGPLSVTPAPDGVLAVAASTVSVRPGSTWTASGLVQNHSSKALTKSAITTVLTDAEGRTLATIQTAIEVPVIRPGEPAPFWVTSLVPPSQVASYSFVVSAERATTLDDRSLEIGTYWALPQGDRERIAGYPVFDPPTGPYPYVRFGSVTNRSTHTIRNVRVLAAWYDNSGHIVHEGWLIQPPPSEADATANSSLAMIPAEYLADWTYRTSDAMAAKGLMETNLAAWAFAEPV